MLTALAFNMIAMAAAKDIDPKIISASLFKNGFAVVTREFDVPSSGTYTIEKIPISSMGSLWFTASEGTRLEDVRATSIDQKNKVGITSTEALLAANVGRQVRVGIKNGDKVTGEIQEGRLLSVGTDFVLIQGSTGTVMIPRFSISSLEASTGILQYQTDAVAPKRVVTVKTSGKAGKVRLVSLERGMTWAPAYAIDVSNSKKLTVVAKATVMNDIEDVNNIEARFVTGFPNVPFSSYLDPLINGGTVDDFERMLQGIGVVNSLPRGRSGEMGGGMGGGGFGGQSSMASNFVNARDFGDAMDNSTLLGAQNEDLFFYKEPSLTLRKGDRSYQVLFTIQSPYTEVYTWDLADNTTNNIEYRPQPMVAPDIWHTLSFKNDSAQPFTTAAATIFKDGQILGQDMMHYVSVGSTAEVKITKALDVHAEADESEESRERGAIRNGQFPQYDRVTLKGTLLVTNGKAKPVTMRITKELTGEIETSTGHPTITKNAKGLRSMNPGAKIVWNETVEPGKTMTITYTYKLLVQSLR